MRILRRLFILFFCQLCLLSLAQAHLPSVYQSLPAGNKQRLIWRECTNSIWQELPDLNSSSWGAVLSKIKGLFNLAPSFDHSSDELPEGRVKIIHSYGSVGLVHFVPLPDHPFTGIYASGALGLVRLSLATTPEPIYTPGMALKFFLPKKPSVNIVAMNALDGQEDNWNFFAKPFSNKIDHPSSFALKVIEKIFESTRTPANDLPVSHLAEIDAQGHIVAKAVAPEQLYFAPAERVQNLISPDSREDFRVSLSTIAEGELYEVYGLYKGDYIHIGTLILDSDLIASEYGDTTLFFQHKR